MDYTIPKYSEDRSVDIGEANKKCLKQGKGTLKFTGVYIHLAPICNFKCKCCYTSSLIEKKFQKLEYAQICGIIDFAKNHGVESIIFAGAGEPMLDPIFDKVCKYVKKKGLQVVLFTNCTQIKNKKRARKLLKNGPVVGKLYTLNEKKYDELVNKKGAFKETMAGLANLMKARSELEKEGKKVTLGIDSYITKLNKEDLIEVMKFCGKNRLIPYLEAFIEINQTKETIKKMALSERELFDFFEGLQKIDFGEFGHKTKIVPFMRVFGQAQCFRATHFFCVHNDGEVYLCACALKKLGQLNQNEPAQKTLGKIFSAKNKKLLKQLDCKGCSKRINPKLLRHQSV